MILFFHLHLAYSKRAATKPSTPAKTVTSATVRCNKIAPQFLWSSGQFTNFGQRPCERWARWAREVALLLWCLCKLSPGTLKFSACVSLRGGLNIRTCPSNALDGRRSWTKVRGKTSTIAVGHRDPFQSCMVNSWGYL